jgi:uncharacterized protein (DUF2126 family)
VRLRLRHETTYKYPTPASLGPHTVRLRPAAHMRGELETYALHVDVEHRLQWQRDALGNSVARVLFRPEALVPQITFCVELVCNVHAVNPFDFVVDERSTTMPFTYPDALKGDLAPFLRLDDAALRSGALVEALSKDLPREGNTVSLLVELNRQVNERVRYVIREEAGVYTPEETLTHGQGSCRDSALLLVRLLRERGLAARFVSGYLVQLKDDGLLPDEKKGMSQDVVDLHAWAEVYLPGAGWVGLDATSGLLCGEGHIPLVSTTSPELAAPIDGTAGTVANGFVVRMEVERLASEPAPVRPYQAGTYEALLAAADLTDARLGEAKVALTIGGEPTWTSRLHAEAPEWRDKALGDTKTEQGARFAQELRREFAPLGCVLRGTGKTYPGESLPRWVLWVLGMRDGAPLFPPREACVATGDLEAAERFAVALAKALEVGVEPLAAYEDPSALLEFEAKLPVDVDPHKGSLDDEDRARLARVLDRGAKAPVGYVLPLARVFGKFRSDHWRFRRERLYLVPGDSPLGLRLPLSSLAGDLLPIPPEEAGKDPRRPKNEHPEAVEDAWKKLVQQGPLGGMRTALAVEPRDGKLHVFLPPFTTADDFIACLAAVDGVRVALSQDVELEGYPPPSKHELFRLMLAPDPGVIELNLPPAASAREYAGFVERAYASALAAGLTSEKYLIDGRLSGSGGGNHVTLGGPSTEESVFLTRPDVFASLLTFVQHHPSLSYAFSGLFVGPTSQAPRVDEGRMDVLPELQIALREAFDVSLGEEPIEPWLVDRLFRDLLVDLTGNTHRAELCIDKLYDFRTAYGRQGVVELRAFEMPPHPHMTVAQGVLMRALVASFCAAPYDHALVNFAARLHDEFLLPYYLEQDLLTVLDHLRRAGFELPVDAFMPFVALRCPLAGTLRAGPVALQVRNALEPWHVLGEELTQSSTARYVDSSVERVEVRTTGLVPEWHVVTVNGVELPMHVTHDPAVHVAGVRFRAWAPPRALQGHLGVHHPLRIEVIDTRAQRSLGACGYHVWHPEGRAFDQPPLTRFEAEARRAQRFTVESPQLAPPKVLRHPMPTGRRTLDLRTLRVDHPVPEPILDPDLPKPPESSAAI